MSFSTLFYVKDPFIWSMDANSDSLELVLKKLNKSKTMDFKVFIK